MNTRKLSCKVCGDKWSSFKGSLMSFYDKHAEKHSLPPAPIFTGEDSSEFLKRFVAWRNDYFEDSYDPTKEVTKCTGKKK